MKKIYVFICSFFLSCSIYAQTPALLLDINPAGNSVRNTTLIYNWNGSGYFAADDGVHGSELWKTDGTIQGTSLFKDCDGGAYGSSPHAFGTLNNKLIFGANDSSHLEKLWISDGTVQGTLIIKEISPYWSPASDIHCMTVEGNLAFFIANDGVHGSELWVSDGTKTGTKMVKDIEPIGETGSFYFTSSLKVLNSKIYFAANETVHGTELWASDGTEAGTKLVKDINPGTGNALVYPNDFILLNGKMFFIADDGVNGNELWVSDGTEAGTHIVKDINSGSASGCSASFEMALYNNKVYFQADNGNMAIGRELWSSDGTAAGTQLLKDINTGSNYSDAKYFCLFDGKLYFWALKNTGPVSTTINIWVTDGTEAGTFMAADTYAGNYTSGKLVAYNGSMYTVYTSASDGLQLFRYDKGATSMAMVSPAVITPNACNPGGYATNAFSIINGNFLYPAVYDGTKGAEFYVFTKPANGIETDYQAKKISLYPNPADKQLHIRMEKDFTSVKFINQQGQIVFSSVNVDQPEVVFDCSSLAPGVYMAQLSSGQQTITGKFIIKH